MVHLHRSLINLCSFCVTDRECRSSSNMSSNSLRRERRASSSSTLSAMSTDSDHNVLENGELDSSQSSQSSRIVNVPRNGAQSHSHLVIAQIEAIFASMVDGLVEPGDVLSIPYRRRNSPQRPLGTLKFPGRSVAEATKFSQLPTMCSLLDRSLLTPP